MKTLKKKRSLKFKRTTSIITSSSGRQYQLEQVWPKRKSRTFVDTLNHNAWRTKEFKVRKHIR